MSASNSEMLVDHVSSLSSAKEPVLFLGFLLLEADPCVWAFCSSRLTLVLKNGFKMILSRADAIFASSIAKFGNLYPRMDCDVIRSSTGLAISTSLIHNSVSAGKTWTGTYFGLEIRLPTLKMKKDQGIYRNAVLRLDSSVTQPYNFTDKLLPLVREDSRLKTSLQISVLKLQNSEGLFPMHSLAQQVFL